MQARPRFIIYALSVTGGAAKRTEVRRRIVNTDSSAGRGCKIDGKHYFCRAARIAFNNRATGYKQLWNCCAVLNGDGQNAGRSQGLKIRTGPQRDREGFIRFSRRVIEDRDLKSLAYLTGIETQRAGGGRIILTCNCGDVGG